MTIKYKCAECGAALNVKDELAGTRGSCPRCQAEFTVPAPEGQEQSWKEPAPARNAEGGKSGDLSDDDIERLLQQSGPTAASPESRLAVANHSDADGQDEEDLDEQPRRRKTEARADDDGFGEDEDDDDERERRRKKKRLAKAGAKKSDPAESASIARELMARGEKGATREDQREKRAGRPFGGRDRPDEEQGFAKQWGLYVGGGLLVIFLCYSFFSRSQLPTLAPVSGTVTLDGSPLPNAMVFFQPTSDSGQPNEKLGASAGETDERGQYTLLYANVEGTQFKGAVIGKHTVRIKKAHATKLDALPARYNFRTELKRDVEKGGKPIDFELTSSEGADEGHPLPGTTQQ